MRLHKEGTATIIIVFLFLVAINCGLWFALSGYLPAIFWFLFVVSVVFYGFILRFFRNPARDIKINNKLITCPADGKIVVIEETSEPEYFRDRRIQVSIFMSPLNVHVNRYPVSGIVSYYRYHKGLKMAAYHPKSSTENERNTIVIKTEDGTEILLRQIAGAVARRIVCYAKEGAKVTRGAEVGFIKFGSRVDLFLPPDAEILVNLEDRVKGNITPIAKLNKD
ncbi:MAG: phosphatidylserine decarboxylase family protein [Bacteroidetes bacterium]|nr:phosphatidylserine decarboxylase family protein [Bacteroidota bacterium]